ncbi:hypothetical protein [Staphylococcus marylandisciuri]|nr:hypothetical protein [Staphylococcus marylandisciuri]
MPGRDYEIFLFKLDFCPAHFLTTDIFILLTLATYIYMAERAA